MTPEVKARLAHNSKLSKARIKWSKGKDLTDQETAMLDEHGYEPTRKGRPRKELTAGDSRVNGDNRESLNEPSAPPPPPPKVEVIGEGKNSKKKSGGTKSDDWRDKHRSSFGGGREGLCLKGAAVYCGLLARLVDFIEEDGGHALIDKTAIAESVFPATVLTLDKLMPEMELTPEMEVAMGSGIILAQAAIVKMKRKKKARMPMPPSHKTKDQVPKESTPPMPEPPKTDGPPNGAPIGYDLSNRNIIR